MHDIDANRKNWSELVIGRPFKERSFKFKFLMFSSLYKIKSVFQMNAVSCHVNYICQWKGKLGSLNSFDTSFDLFIYLPGGSS